MKSTAASPAHDQKPRQLHPQSTERGRATPFKLVVLARDTADLVAAAGGLVFDSVSAGCTVEVYIESNCNERALRILGVDGHVMPAAFECDLDWPDAIFLAAPLHDRHPGVQRLMADAARRHGADVKVWDMSSPSRRGEIGVDHRLSTAARAFKQHALSAAGLALEVLPIEPFRNGMKR